MGALSLIWKLLHTYDASENDVKEATPTTAPLPEKEGLDAVLDQLNQLIGMENIKAEVRTLTNFLKVQKVRAGRGLAKTPVSLHSVFSGPPGTGKTTVARLVSKLFKELGFLEKGHLVETDRAGMVADYIGGTSKKVDEKVTSALDGVLFIDEAYALIPEDSARDFGQEAVNVLLKRMEDYRDRLVVIAAGYTDEMLRLIESNPGLKSRFNRYFYFNDYTPNELVAIFNKFCKDSHFSPTEAANQKLNELLTELYERRDRTFGNARLVRNLFEKTIEQQANRLAVINTLTDEILITILPEDIPPIETVTPQQGATTSDRTAPHEAIPLDQQSPPSATQRREAFINQLTTLLNQSLQSMGITAKVNLKSDVLRIIFEADSVPNPAEMAALTGSLLKRLLPEDLACIQLYGRLLGDEFPDWSQEFELNDEG
ncbi:MAG: AAA family ATPase [Leptolyngbyaceae cyanobacterium RU_5_1]|nr:AAA family ATPase [Leptolyngbyaceae cyanobacterium RU_5_1]